VAKLEPRVAKLSANVGILALLNDTSKNKEDTFENEEDTFKNEEDTFENDSVVKLCEGDVQKLIHLFYIKIGSPSPKDWYGKGGTILETIKALAMSADECRKVEQVITDT
jgi:hypothetical protein